MLVTFGVVAAFVGMKITPEQSLTRFPDIKAARTVENSLYLGVLLLWVIHCLALYRGLRRTSPTPALFGTALSILGLVVLAAGALPHVATAPISDLYHAAGGDPAGSGDPGAGVARHPRHVRRAAVHRTRHRPAGPDPLGAAMLRAPGYGTPMGRTTIALGAATLAAATAVLVGVTDMAAVGVLGLTGFHLTLGWRTHRLAGTTRSTMLTGA